MSSFRLHLGRCWINALDELLKIGEHLSIEVPDKRAKARIKIFLLDKLVEQEVLPNEFFSDKDETSTAVSTHDTKLPAVSTVSLTFNNKRNCS